MTDRTLADVLAEFGHDEAFCGAMTTQGLPCQCPVEHEISGRCSQHAPNTSGVTSVMEAINNVASMYLDFLEQAIQPLAEAADASRRRHRIRTMYAEFDPANEPPALPPGDGSALARLDATEDDA